MKRYGGLIIFVGVVMCVLGGLVADIGEVQPSYVIDFWLAIKGVIIFSILFLLGWSFGKEQS